MNFKQLGRKEIWRLSALKAETRRKEEAKKHELSMRILKVGGFLLLSMAIFMQGGV